MNDPAHLMLVQKRKLVSLEGNEFEVDIFDDQ